ncbi:MAG: phosphohydrolase, partial [Flavobacteriaceae bacterium]
SIELKVVQDADRLDAIGAIGIARAFHYGGFKNRLLYDPEIEPNLGMDKETYKRSQSPTINHFYEKLLLLKDQMNTETGKAMACDRHQFMLGYLDQFYQEWEGEI